MPITRELSVTYAGVTLGGSSARQIEGYTIVGPKEYERAAVEISFVTAGHASESAFVTECQTLEAAFRTPRGDFVLTLGSTTLLSLKHTDNTGFDCEPSIIKAGDPADTGRSRHYTVRFEFGLPADNVGTSFRRDSTVTVEYAPSRKRTVTIQGTYTANSSDGTTTAYAQYNAQIATYAAVVLAVVDASATWELVSEPQTTRNETNKVCTFVVVYKEILFNQSASGLDDSDIIDPSVIITANASAPGDSMAGGVNIGASGARGVSAGGAGIGPSNSTSPTVFETNLGGGPVGQTVTQQRPILTTLVFSCFFNRSTITSLASMKAKWANNLRGYLINVAGQVTTGALVLLDEKPSFDPHERKMSATMEFITYTSNVFEVTITLTDHMTYNLIEKPVWSGDPYERYEYQGPPIKQRIVTEEYKKKVDSADPYSEIQKLQGNVGDKLISAIMNDSQWALVSRKPTLPVKLQGLPGSSTALIAEIHLETVAERRNRKRANKANVGGVTGGFPDVATGHSGTHG
jgi:hypothetical protein